MFNCYLFDIFLGMTRSLRTLSIILLLAVSPMAGFAASDYFSFMNVTVQLADSADAAKFIKQEDAYSRSFSKFDMHSRFGDGKMHTTAEYLAWAGKQMRSWNTSEGEEIKKGFKEIETFLKSNQLNIALPDTILFIKSTCLEEYGASGYTRNNGIVIKMDEPAGIGLIAHELFHVISRNNSLLRDRLYENIGFKKCNTINITKAMNGLNITNPDCPVINHYVTVGGEDMTLVLHSKKPYEGGNVFEDGYINISLLALTGSADNKTPLMKDGKAVLYNLEDKPELFAIIGTITPYVLHPEEICAEHFVTLVTQKTVKEPQYIQAIKEDLGK